MIVPKALELGSNSQSERGTTLKDKIIVAKDEGRSNVSMPIYQYEMAAVTMPMVRPPTPNLTDELKNHYTIG